ncbi:MAG: hypothetical protein P8X42_11675 [Calditrichaceae bacterium]|jgi:hypothetical protein
MFEDFSDNAQIWIYGFDKTLTSDDKKVVRDYLDNFIRQWHSHKVPVHGDYSIMYDRFVILAAETDVSGCSIDSSVGIFKTLQENYNLNALNQDLVYYKNQNSVISLSRDEFQSLVDKGNIDPDTPVFNLALTGLSELRNGQWELPFSKSWHGQVFKKSA